MEMWKHVLGIKMMGMILQARWNETIARQEQTSDIGGDTMVTYLDGRQRTIDDREFYIRWTLSDEREGERCMEKGMDQGICAPGLVR